MELLHGICLVRAAARRMLLELRPASACTTAFCRSSCRPYASTVAGRPIQVFISCYISTAIPSETTANSSAPIAFKRLLPPGDPAEAQEIVAGLGLHERSHGVPISGGRERPYVVLNMVATLDGRATLNGRSGPISDPADRALFHGLRSVVDAVMAGAGTVRAERYGPIVPDPDRRRLRAERGLRRAAARLRRLREPRPGAGAAAAGRPGLHGRDRDRLAAEPAGEQPPASSTYAPAARTSRSTSPPRWPSCTIACTSAPCCARAGPI